ncbi:2',3'-cyclic-nucleotide 3'-phosphodiesterase [Mycena floridula]|nr:2',3'-cyclic-nucleotide 3'-phosphodiesterase [Mycena floridula]
MKFTLWLVPSANDAKSLQEIMKTRPSSSTATKDESYPTFFPHITLGTFDLPAIPSPELLTFDSLQADFSSIDIGDHFFRSVYIAIQPTEQLSALHAHVHSLLKAEPRTPSFPHLSLCYITDEDAADDERERFKEALKILQREGGVTLVHGEETIAGFWCSEMWITRCEGAVESWSILHKVPARNIQQ